MEPTSIAGLSAALLALPRDDWDALWVATGVPRSTIEKIAYGVTTNPSFKSVAALTEELQRRRATVG